MLARTKQDWPRIHMLRLLALAAVMWVGWRLNFSGKDAQGERAGARWDRSAEAALYLNFLHGSKIFCL